MRKSNTRRETARGRASGLVAAVLTAALLGLGCAGAREADTMPSGSTTPTGSTMTPVAQPDSGGEQRLDLGALPEECRIAAECGDLVGVDCGQAADGPYYYAERATGRVVEICGGACMNRDQPDRPWCKQCPPAGWTCQEQTL
jgi:hypothetical protein